MLDDLQKFSGSRLEIIEQLRPTYERLEEAGYEYRGAETRHVGTEGYVLLVWTRGDWLVRVKHFERGEAELAAFNDEGFLCPLEDALAPL